MKKIKLFFITIALFSITTTVFSQTIEGENCLTKEELKSNGQIKSREDFEASLLAYSYMRQMEIITLVSLIQNEINESPTINPTLIKRANNLKDELQNSINSDGKNDSAIMCLVQQWGHN